jgi:hypothetical protein
VDNVPAHRTERDADRLGDNVDVAFQRLAGIDIERNCPSARRAMPGQRRGDQPLADPSAVKLPSTRPVAGQHGKQGLVLGPAVQAQDRTLDQGPATSPRSE